MVKLHLGAFVDLGMSKLCEACVIDLCGDFTIGYDVLPRGTPGVMMCLSYWIGITLYVTLLLLPSQIKSSLFLFWDVPN